MAKGDFDRKMAEAMRGRYGSDELNNLLNAIVLVLLIINIFAQQTWLLLIALALVVCVGWRIMSKNVEARRNENELFLDHAGRFRPWLRNAQGGAHVQARGLPGLRAEGSCAAWQGQTSRNLPQVPQEVRGQVLAKTCADTR